MNARDNAPAPAEAATEIGAEPIERMGPLRPWERFAIEHSVGIAIACCLCFAFVIWATKP